MEDTLTDTLAPAQAALWQEYLAAEARGIKADTLATLRAFVAALQDGPAERRYSFAAEFCRQVADAGQALPLREPLFADIIGPFLVSASRNGNGDAERWLTCFHPQFANMPPSQRLIELPDVSPIDLLGEAFRRDPADARTREQLIQMLQNNFEYAVHEVPAGVLHGFDGATVAECQEWQDDLALFREVAEAHGVIARYEAAIRYWGFHFHGYADYLTHRAGYENYTDYIERHGQACGMIARG